MRACTRGRAKRIKNSTSRNSVYAILARANTSVSANTRCDVWANSNISFFFRQTIPRITGNLVSRFDYTSVRKLHAYAPQSFHSFRLLFPLHRREKKEGEEKKQEEEEKTKWMVNKCVSETCFDISDNKGPLRAYKRYCIHLLGIPVLPRFSLNILKILNGASKLEKQMSARVDAFSLDIVLLNARVAAPAIAFILFTFTYVLTWSRVMITWCRVFIVSIFMIAMQVKDIVWILLFIFYKLISQ